MARQPFKLRRRAGNCKSLDCGAGQSSIVSEPMILIVSSSSSPNKRIEELWARSGLVQRAREHVRYRQVSIHYSVKNLDVSQVCGPGQCI